MSATSWGWLVLAFPLAGMLVIALGWRVLPDTVAGWIGSAAIGGAFASAIIGLNDHREQFSPRFMAGISAGPYLAWLSGTTIGALFGGILSAFPVVDAAMGFLMPALFLAMVLSLLTREHIPVVIVTVLAAIPLIVLVSPTVGIIGAMVIGALSSLLPIGRARR